MNFTFTRRRAPHHQQGACIHAPAPASDPVARAQAVTDREGPAGSLHHPIPSKFGPVGAEELGALVGPTDVPESTKDAVLVQRTYLWMVPRSPPLSLPPASCAAPPYRRPPIATPVRAARVDPLWSSGRSPDAVGRGRRTRRCASSCSALSSVRSARNLKFTGLTHNFPVDPAV
jgi:hypothetical protein